CIEGCQRCVWDHHSGVGSVCLRCGAPDDLLLGDHCVSRCPRGLHPWHGACRRCHSSCEGCRGPDPKSCTSCPAGHFLITSGVCASACPVGYYDNGHRVCQACDHQCGSCSGPGVCLSCRDPAKVLLFGECQYERCAHQYYLNTTTRTCTGTPQPHHTYQYYLNTTTRTCTATPQHHHTHLHRWASTQPHKPGEVLLNTTSHTCTGLPLIHHTDLHSFMVVHGDMMSCGLDDALECVY
ncbi:unnamed protein product, partial [Gadus morhua 'NCC']